MVLNQERIEALILMAISLFAIWGAMAVPEPTMGDTWAGILPFVAGIALLATSLIMLITQTAEKSSLSNSLDWLPLLALFALAWVYQSSLSMFGHFLPTAIVAPLVLSMFGVRNLKGLLLAVILVPLAFHFVFFEVLGVYPPYGEVFDLLDWLKS